MTVSGIRDSNYDVYVYDDMDASGRNETVSLTPSGSSAQYYSFLTQKGGSVWTVATSTWNGSGTVPTLPAANYAHYAGLTGSSFTMTWWAPGNGSINAIQIVPNPPALPSPWTSQDIGAVGTSGSASYTNGVFTIKGAGTLNYTSGTDAFQYVSQSTSGTSCNIIARVSSQTAPTSSARAGVMIRETDSPTSAYVFMGIQPNAFYWSQRLENGSGAKSQWTDNAAPNNWVQLTRTGNTFIGYTSSDGATWTQRVSLTINMATNATMGMAVCSGTTSTSTVTLDNVTASP